MQKTEKNQVNRFDEPTEDQLEEATELMIKQVIADQKRVKEILKKDIENRMQELKQITNGK
jgi:hypothetical protein